MADLVTEIEKSLQLHLRGREKVIAARHSVMKAIAVCYPRIVQLEEFREFVASFAEAEEDDELGEIVRVHNATIRRAREVGE